MKYSEQDPYSFKVEVNNEVNDITDSVGRNKNLIYHLLKESETEDCILPDNKDRKKEKNETEKMTKKAEKSPHKCHVCTFCGKFFQH
jgi:hypothetical protein